VASPQVENGYTRLANDLYEALGRAPFNRREYKLLHAVVRDTYGWNRKMTKTPKLELFRRVGLRPEHGYTTLKDLLDRQVLVENEGGVGLQKDFDRWRPKSSAKTVLVPKQHYSQSSTSGVAKSALVTSAESALPNSRERPSGVASQTPKDTLKDISKDNTPYSPPRGTALDGFEAFWTAYPKKVGKRAALRAWKKIKGLSLVKILQALEEQKQWEQWRREHGRFIPHPATWLNQGRWDDQPIDKPKRKTGPAW
jgi:phage replication O-like protein O